MGCPCHESKVYSITMPYDPFGDTCDCDQRCSKCGKKKGFGYRPYFRYPDYPRRDGLTYI